MKKLRKIQLETAFFLKNSQFSVIFFPVKKLYPNLTGRQLTHKEVSEQHYQSVTRLQKAAFRLFNETMKEFYVLNVSGVDTRRALQKQFGDMNHAEVYRFAEYLHLVPAFGGTFREIWSFFFGLFLRKIWTKIGR